MLGHSAEFERSGGLSSFVDHVDIFCLSSRVLFNFTGAFNDFLGTSLFVFFLISVGQRGR